MPRGGKRPGAGRHKSGRTQIKIRIKTEIIESLQPGAARKLRELIEKQPLAPTLEPEIRSVYFQLFDND